MVLFWLHIRYNISCRNSSNNLITIWRSIWEKNQRIEGRASLDSSDWNECRWYCYNTNHVYAGLIGSGIFSLIGNGGSSSAVARLTSNPSVMVQFISPIVAFAGLRSLGVIAGGISYMATYLQKN